MLSASTAHSGRNSSEFRRPVRGSECASQRIQKRFRKRLRIRLQSRERSGAKRRESEPSRRSAHGPPLPQLSTAFRNACQRGRRGCPQQPLTLAGILPNSGASFAALNARPNAFRNDFGNAFGYGFRYAFGAASGAARSAAGASGPGAPRTARRCHNCPRHFPAHVGAEDGAVRSNRSLWPSFAPNDGASFAALKARPNAFRNDFGNAFGYAFRYAFRAASEAARSAARASGPGAPHTARRCPNCPRHFAAHVSAEDGAVRSNRSLWPSFAPNDGASFAALKARPNTFRNDFGNAFGYGFRYAFRAASGAARSAAGASGPGVPRTARRCHNCPRHFATHVSAEDGAVRSNRSLWPEFCRIPAPRSRL